MHQMQSRNVLCIIFKNLVCNEINESKLVSALNYFLQMVFVIKWSSFLSV